MILKVELPPRAMCVVEEGASGRKRPRSRWTSWDSYTVSFLTLILLVLSFFVE